MEASDFKAIKLDSAQCELVADFEIQFRVLATRIADEIPASAHRTAALRKLLEAKMTAIHAISRSIVVPKTDEGAACNTEFGRG